RACAQARPWHATRGIAVSVNISGRQLVSGDLTGTVADALAASGLPPEALIIEVTETSLLASATVERAVAQLDELRGWGVRLALGASASASSSLCYLARLPVDLLAIDGSFFAPGPAFGPDDWSFARATTELGRSQGLTVVAEGIETPEQADALRQLNC